jgi:hypothetical protein
MMLAGELVGGLAQPPLKQESSRKPSTAVDLYLGAFRGFIGAVIR